MEAGAVMVRLERVVGYMVAEKKIKTWTPIFCVLAMQHFAKKCGSYNSFYTKCIENRCRLSIKYMR